eukprot:scaffold93122_cov32-Tisochrysis_lutea.AAC.3
MRPCQHLSRPQQAGAFSAQSGVRARASSPPLQNGRMHTNTTQHLRGLATERGWPELASRRRAASTAPCVAELRDVAAAVEDWKEVQEEGRRGEPRSPRMAAAIVRRIGSEMLCGQRGSKKMADAIVRCRCHPPRRAVHVQGWPCVGSNHYLDEAVLGRHHSWYATKMDWPRPQQMKVCVYL